MKIALLGPCDLTPFKSQFENDKPLPPTYSFPYISQLAQAYINYGHEVEIVTSSEHVSAPGHWQGSDGLGVHIVPRRSAARSRALDFFAEEAKWIAAATKQTKADVVHGHWIYEFAQGALDAQRDALVTAHDAPLSVVRHYGRHPYWWFREALGVKTLWATQNITAVSPSLARELRPFVRGNTDIHVIPNGLPAKLNHELSIRSSIRCFDRPVFAVVSNGFDRRKNTSLALRAFSSLRKKIPGSQMHMFGNGHELGGAADRWSKSRGIHHNVRFFGPVAHDALLEQISATVDVIVHPSRWEACSLAILEARALGIPVIGGLRAGGVGYTLDYGNAGFLVSQNADAYAGAMATLATNSQYYHEISGHAATGVATNFNIDTVVETYLDLLGKIISSRVHRVP